MLGLLVIVLTFLIAVAATVLALRLPAEFQYWKFITGAIAAGLLLGAITYWQQMRAVTRAAQDRDNAIAEASNHVVYETTQRVTQEIGKRYEQQVKSLTKQVADLEANAGTGAGSQAGATPGIFWIQGDEKVGRGSAEIQFRIYGPLDTAAFIAVCERPCKAVGGQAGPGSEGIPLVGSADQDIAGFLFKKPRPMPAGTEGTITVQSSDRGPIKVASFRILHESEIPAGLK